MKEILQNHRSARLETEPRLESEKSAKIGPPENLFQNRIRQQHIGTVQSFLVKRTRLMRRHTKNDENGARSSEERILSRPGRDSPETPLLSRTLHDVRDNYAREESFRTRDGTRNKPIIRTTLGNNKRHSWLVRRPAPFQGTSTTPDRLIPSPDQPESPKRSPDRTLLARKKSSPTHTSRREKRSSLLHLSRGLFTPISRH